MSEKESKLVSIIMFAFFIMIVVMYHKQKDNSLIKNRKYTIVKILNSEVFGKNFTNYEFFFEGKYRNNTSNRFLYKSERDSIIGKKVLIEYDSLDLDNSEIIFGYQIPQNMSEPKNGWKTIPKNIKKIY